MDTAKQSGTAAIKTAQGEYPLGWSDIGKVLLASLLGSFALRGGIGAAKLIGRRFSKPIEPEEEEEPRRPLALPASKYAAVKSGEDKGMHPAVTSALALGAGGLGAYGGWRLADWLFDRRRRQELESEIERKKKEYEDLLLGKPQIELRVPKVAACIEHYADLHEHGEQPAEMEKTSIDMWKALPYMAYLTLAALVANEAAGAYRKSRRGSEMERRLTAFRGRPRVRARPARAYLSQPRPAQREILTSATRLPELTHSKLTGEEREEDPARGR